MNPPPIKAKMQAWALDHAAEANARRHARVVERVAVANARAYLRQMSRELDRDEVRRVAEIIRAQVRSQ